MIIKFIGLTFEVSKLDIIKMVRFLFICVKKKERKSPYWRKILATHLSDKGKTMSNKNTT